MFNPGSPQAAAISHLFLVVLVICAVIFGVVVGLVSAAIFRFRRQPGAGEPRQIFGNLKLEILWTLVPCLILAWLAVLTYRGMSLSDPPVTRPPDLVVIAHQWWWEVRYPPSGVVTANEIHIPAGRKLLVRLESADVIHDFWVPALSRKMDMIPGQPNHLWLESDQPGVFAGTCSEFCGAEHAWMRFTVVAQAPQAYDAWLAQQAMPAALPVTDSAKKGLKLFETMTCVNCHSIRGISEAGSAGPDLTHFAGRDMLGAGVLRNTPANLARWLKDPQAVKPGTQMPNLKLTDAQIKDLVSYLGTKD